MTVFERHPKSTLASIVLILALLALIGLEWSAKHFFGLGKVVIYEAHPLYGYRPVPNQTVARQHNVEVKINNLGLRASSDWDKNNTKDKILFLGDSVTYGGSYISNEALFSHLAVQTFPQWQSGNAGVNGWGVSNLRAFIIDMEFLPADVYVTVLPEGDFYRGINRIGGQPFWTTAPRYALEELFHYGIYQLALKKSPPDFAYTQDPVQKTKVAESAVKDLKTLDNFLKAHDKIHLIYITPSRSQLLKGEPSDKIIQSLLEKYELKVDYLADRLPAASHHEKASWFHDNIHLSEAGHHQWANIIASDLSNIKVSS
jgi:hypothetical protein